MGSFGGNWAKSGFGMLVCWGNDDIEYLDLFPSCSGCIYIYVLDYELIIGGPTPFIVEFYFISPKQKGKKKEK